jgi:V8-like Glu-specific endopeptidase
MTSAQSSDRLSLKQAGSNISLFGSDNRKRVTTTTSYPWNSIGFIRVKFPDGNWYGSSGVMISPYHFLTAGHAIKDQNLGRNIDSSRTTDDQGWAETAYISLGQSGTQRYYGEAKGVYFRTVSGWAANEREGYDWAIVTLDRNMGNSTGWMGMAARSDRYFKRKKVTSTGYPYDRAKNWGNFATSGHVVSQYKMNGPINVVAKTKLFYRFDTAGGQSGGPIWRLEGSKPYVFGVHAYGNSIYKRAKYNSATRVQPYMVNLFNTWKGDDDQTRSPIDRPDLMDAGVWFKSRLAYVSASQISSGGYLQAKTTVRNNGTATAGNFKVSFYASPDAFVDTDGRDYLLGSVSVSALAPFTQTDVIWQGNANIPSGSYYVGWAIDAENSITEFNETDNKAILDQSPLQITSSGVLARRTPSDLLLGGTSRQGLVQATSQDDLLAGGQTSGRKLATIQRTSRFMGQSAGGQLASSSLTPTQSIYTPYFTFSDLGSSNRFSIADPHAKTAANSFLPAMGQESLG